MPAPRRAPRPAAAAALTAVAAALTAAAAAALLAPATARAQAQPFTSYRKLTTANGWAAAVYDLEARRITHFRENMYRYPEPGRETRNLAYDAYLGLRSGGRGGWLTDVRLEEGGYEVGTNLVRTVQLSEGARVTTTYYAPFSLPARALIVVAEVTATRALPDLTLYSLHNFHLGSGAAGTTGERITWDGRALIERGAGTGALVALPLTTASHHTASPDNPFGLVQAGRPFADTVPAGPLDDAVSGLQFDVGPLAAGQTAWIALALAWAPDGDTAALVTALQAWQAGRAPRELLDDARAEWRAWLREGVLPAATAAEEDVALQSMAILRMGQVREGGAPDGQILASLPPGQWDIAWVRDAMWAVDALHRTGHHAEVERALEFYLRGPVGEYRNYVGRDYALSVCRYYGNGREESDSNARGPNVELDGFGLFLEQAAAHGRAAPAWLAQRADRVSSGVADVLVDTADGPTGLVMADSSIWESHWTDGGRQRWVFTSGTAARGLTAWADALAARDPADPRAARYRARAAALVQAIQAHLVDPASGGLAASVEQRSRPDGAFADAQAALILGPQTIPASSAVGLATLDLLRQRLFLGATTRRGYKRNDDGDLYDEREWVVVDLGISRALREAGRTADADALLDWVTGQATANFGIVPELLDQTTARYAGETPMIGFGAGAYLGALIHRSGTRPVDPPSADAGVTDDDAHAEPTADADTDARVEPTPDAEAMDAGPAAPADAAPPAAVRDAGRAPTPALPDRGCACGAGGAPTPSSWLLAALTLALARPRRRGTRPGSARIEDRHTVR